MADDKPKPRAKKKKHRCASSQDEYARYIVAIEGWDWSYSFGLAGRKDGDHQTPPPRLGLNKSGPLTGANH
jgi:hypothetical protein